MGIISVAGKGKI